MSLKCFSCLIKTKCLSFLDHLCKLGLFISIYSHTVVILVMFMCLGHILCITVIFMGLLHSSLSKKFIKKCVILLVTDLIMIIST